MPSFLQPVAGSEHIDLPESNFHRYGNTQLRNLESINQIGHVMGLQIWLCRPQPLVHDI